MNILFIFCLATTMALPTPQPTPLTPFTVNPYLEATPCGGEMDMNYQPSESDLSESLAELEPNINQIKSSLNALITYMAANRIQSSFMRTIAQQFAPTKYPSDVFPHPLINFFSDTIFSDMYFNMSMVEIYSKRLTEVETSHVDDNDAQILGHLENVSKAVQKIRCHLQVILRFYNQSIPTVDFSVEESQIDHPSRSNRYIKHYQIYYMTKLLVNSYDEFLSIL